MPKHYSHYVFFVQDYGKVIITGRNEKEARRNFAKDYPFGYKNCPKIKLLSCHGSFRDALEWRENDNKENS